MSHMDFPLEYKRLPDGEGRLSGLAATFGNLDSVNDIIVPGAFAESLKRRPASKVRLLAFHNPNEPIGRIDLLEETKEGLQIDATLARGVQRADEVERLINMGALDSASIGFRAKKSTRDRKTGARLLEKIDLFEVSVVSMPANEQALIRTVKRSDFGTVRRDEDALRRLGYSRREAQLIIAKGFRALYEQTSDDLRDAGKDDELAEAIRRCRDIISPKGNPDGISGIQRPNR